MPTSPIQMPSGYATAFAIGFTDGESSSLSLVENGRPLPVTTLSASTPEPLTGTTATSTSTGPFLPAPGRPVFITLTGIWQGSATLLRSIDGGVTQQPLTLGGDAWGTFSQNVCEPVWEEFESGAALYLAITLTSGSLTYRVAQ
ncbi:hypothetical protein QUC32_25780 [Novosphingobium resinovorum]|uniref:hypothetical protein n=1 Tax=Novosphingobium TaxID=165696 RepID=UPI000A638DE2|nr:MULTISPECIES: hypothetical protein [Novosphingobium]MBF7013038.1 hypothetical protein [Novosphingobium sp. HR1a]WJM27771.1 hypothetical protein QUC32_25780 [Novosphingobium resinovorum]